ncbi:ADP-ribosylation factor-like 4aa isoform X3 [Pseudorasbora parva]|uniref:ADP-ribosylation factor-like 4aa isoform X3 n=1 Tax=Pseudorasbora parva TaxID=51549 RepID=UPI00351F6D4D
MECQEMETGSSTPGCHHISATAVTSSCRRALVRSSERRDLTTSSLADFRYKAPTTPAFLPTQCLHSYICLDSQERWRVVAHGGPRCIAETRGARRNITDGLAHLSEDGVMWTCLCLTGRQRSNDIVEGEEPFLSPASLCDTWQKRPVAA